MKVILGNEEVNSICNLLEFCLKHNKVVSEKIEPVKKIVQTLKNQQLEMPANQEELGIQKLISNLESRENSLGNTIDKLKELEKTRDNKIIVKFDSEWKKIIQHLLENVEDSKEGIDVLMKQYDHLLERLGNIERIVDKLGNGEKGDPLRKSQIAPFEEKSMEETKDEEPKPQERRELIFD